MCAETNISSVKDLSLIEKRHRQITKVAMKLFKLKGYDKTTTREIAKESGFSIGTLYEYIRTKEDVLLLVFEEINKKVYSPLQETINLKSPSIENLIHIFDAYFRLMDQVQEEVIILYQELKSLPQEAKDAVLQKETEMVEIVKQSILTMGPANLSEAEAHLIANNLFVQGHMWGFRRWALQKEFTLDQYIEHQIKFTLNMMNIDQVIGN